MSIKISELPQATSVTSSDVVPIVQNGTTKKVNADLMNLDVYSTTEQRIGTWIDGKPIYRKTIPLTNLPTANNYTDTSINYSLNDITPLNLQTIILNNWGGYANNYVGSNSAYVSVSFAVNDALGNPIQIRVRSSLNISSHTGYATIEYTKTTDTTTSTLNLTRTLNTIDDGDIAETKLASEQVEQVEQVKEQVEDIKEAKEVEETTDTNTSGDTK